MQIPSLPCRSVDQHCALFPCSFDSPLPASRWTYLLPVKTPLVSLQCHIFFTRYFEASPEDLLYITGVCVMCHNCLYFVGRKLRIAAVSHACRGKGTASGAASTLNPGDEAQTLVPWLLNMAALSTLPEPIRLFSR